MEPPAGAAQAGILYKRNPQAAAWSRKWSQSPVLPWTQRAYETCLSAGSTATLADGHLNWSPHPELHRANSHTKGVHRSKCFADLLAGQYDGDPEPTVTMEEADRLRIIAAGGYSGARPNVPERLQHSWQICDSRDRIIVLASENHGWGIQYQRYELRKSALDLTPGRLDDGGDLEPDLAVLIRPMLEAPLIQEWAEG